MARGVYTAIPDDVAGGSASGSGSVPGQDGVVKVGEIDDAQVVVSGEDRWVLYHLLSDNSVTLFVWMLVSAAALSGMCFGYDTGVISGTLVSIGSDLGAPLSVVQKELITSATTLGALIGGGAAGLTSDYTGRKAVLLLANVVFVAGALVQAAAHAVWSMVAGRFVVGLGVGLASCIAPLYIGELAPSRLRGRLVTVNAVACTLGQVIAYGGYSKSPLTAGVGALLAKAAAWRWMVGLGAIPALVQTLALVFLPESREFPVLHTHPSSYPPPTRGNRQC